MALSNLFGRQLGDKRTENAPHPTFVVRNPVVPTLSTLPASGSSSLLQAYASLIPPSDPPKTTTTPSAATKPPSLFSDPQKTTVPAKKAEATPVVTENGAPKVVISSETPSQPKVVRKRGPKPKLDIGNKVAETAAPAAAQDTSLAKVPRRRGPSKAKAKAAAEKYFDRAAVEEKPAKKPRKTPVKPKISAPAKIVAPPSEEAASSDGGEGDSDDEGVDITRDDDDGIEAATRRIEERMNGKRKFDVDDNDAEVIDYDEEEDDDFDPDADSSSQGSLKEFLIDDADVSSTDSDESDELDEIEARAEKVTTQILNAKSLTKGDGKQIRRARILDDDIEPYRVPMEVAPPVAQEPIVKPAPVAVVQDVAQPTKKPAAPRKKRAVTKPKVMMVTSDKPDDIVVMTPAPPPSAPVENQAQSSAIVPLQPMVVMNPINNNPSLSSGPANMVLTMLGTTYQLFEKMGIKSMRADFGNASIQVDFQTRQTDRT